MKVYKFIFIVGFLNLTIPFLGIPFVYKNYTLITLAIVTIAYALIVRAVEKERDSVHFQQKHATQNSKKTIEEVVDMVEEKEPLIISDVIPNRRRKRSKVIVQEQIYE